MGVEARKIAKANVEVASARTRVHRGKRTK